LFDFYSCRRQSAIQRVRCVSLRSVRDVRLWSTSTV